MALHRCGTMHQSCQTVPGTHPKPKILHRNEREEMPMMKTYTGLIACAMLLATINTAAVAGPADEARQHVDMAQKTLSNFMRDPNMTWIQANLPAAKGVLIVPKVTKVGFVFGGSGGRG